MRRDIKTSYQSDMDEYIYHYGFHFNEKLYRFAVALMHGKKVEEMTDAEYSKYPDRTLLRQKMKDASIKLTNDVGYDALYVYAMAKSDYYGSSIIDEPRLLLFIHDYLDDVDGAESRAFDEFYAKTVALGIPIFWGDML